MLDGLGLRLCARRCDIVNYVAVDFNDQHANFYFHVCDDNCTAPVNVNVAVDFDNAVDNHDHAEAVQAPEAVPGDGDQGGDQHAAA
jgi:hypothetical protein